MEDQRAVQPLRIQKSTNSPSKSPILTRMAGPLAEVSPMGIRRNSPSFNQINKPAFSGDSSPFEASPVNSSPRHFWKDREAVSPTRFNGSENTSSKPAKTVPRRSSLEKLQKASRVKNSNIFARESFNAHDTNSPQSTARPLSIQHHGNAWAGIGVTGQLSSKKGHRRSESRSSAQFGSPQQPTEETKATGSLEDSQNSPQKSSLSSHSRFGNPSTFNPDQGTWSEDEETMTGHGSDTPRAGARSPMKTVSFDVAPPQVKEYEQVTPDPSSVASGSREGSYDSMDSFDIEVAFERGSSEEGDSFDASLEDVGKTPVVLPEDWRFMSPEAANTELANTFEDPFEGRDEGHISPNNRGIMQVAEDLLSRSDSVNSDGERRPLPPLPSLSELHSGPDKNAEVSKSRLSNHEIQRSLPVPPRPASLSKADIIGMSDSAMPLEERLRRLTSQELPKDAPENESVTADAPEQWPLKTDDLEDRSDENQLRCQEPESGREETNFSRKTRGPPKISRESILRKVKSQHFDKDDNDDSLVASSPVQDQEHTKYVDLDPDEPIPSRETSSNYEVSGHDQMMIKQEEDDAASVLDMYAQYEPNEISECSPSQAGASDKDISVARNQFHDQHGNADELQGAAASYDENESTSESAAGSAPADVDGDISKLGEANCSEHKKSQSVGITDNHRMSLPDFTSFGSDENFSLGLKSYMSPSPPDQADQPEKAAEQEDTGAEPEQTQDDNSNDRLQTPEDQLQSPRMFSSDSAVEDTGTPDSVIHHPIRAESPKTDSPSVPGRVATVRAQGGKLKTRPSVSAAELEELNAELRHTSDGRPPPVPSQFKKRGDKAEPEDAYHECHETLAKDSPPKRRQSLNVQLDMPMSGFSDELGLGIDEEFDRVMEAQKVESTPVPSQILSLPQDHGVAGAERIAGQGFSPQCNGADVCSPRQRGYLMRHNTKVVIANRNVSNESKNREQPTIEKPPAPTRETKSAGNSPRKPSGPAFTTEPWNGKARRRSTRRSSINPETGLPGGLMQSPQGHDNILGTLAESPNLVADESADSADRGRFFVKVVGVKDLDLPLPRNERSWFQLTLDNGLHCVTTAWLELGKNAPIGQEFELTVFHELDFSLTLQTKLERPRSQASSESSFSSPTKLGRATKPFAISRLLTSPKKRREIEKRQQEEEALAARQRQRELDVQRVKAEPSAWELLHNLVGPDGSFARSVVSLEDHERKAYGRPYIVEVPCFNNWATEDGTSTNSARSKHGGVQRKPPYKIGKLELQLLFIPRPKGIKGQDMPQSMGTCTKQLREAEATVTRHHEGWLSQQGADCPHWRRRYFQLNGTNLSAYHEITKRRRFNLNLAKVRKLIDDGSSLKQAGAKSRRKSAFGEDEEGYMFLPEGFRIQFVDGTYVDFYAESVQQKEEWMHVLSEAVGKDAGTGKMSWTSVVLAKEREEATRQAASTTAKRPRQSQGGQRVASKSAPTTPAKPKRPQSAIYDKPPPPISKSPQMRDPRALAARVPRQGGNSATRQNVRSMIF